MSSAASTPTTPLKKPPAYVPNPPNPTSIISLINPGSQPRNNTGNEALGWAGFGLEK
ncbi:MAG: hypothetical protein NTV84_04645 [Methanoregula sp.]|nr:hypothetical protein [Methanoregula sp.]